MNSKGEVGRYDVNIPFNPGLLPDGRKDVSGCGVSGPCTPKGRPMESSAEVRMRQPPKGSVSGGWNSGTPPAPTTGR
jgi:hypothetical protein